MFIRRSWRLAFIGMRNMGCGYLLVVAELVHNSLGSHLCVQLHQVGSLNMLMLGILIPCRYHK